MNKFKEFWKDENSKKVWEIWISENPKTGFRLFKRFRSTPEIALSMERNLKSAYYTQLKEVG